MDELTVTLVIPGDVIEAIAEKVAALIPGSRPTNESPFLNVEEAAEYLRTPRQRIYDLCSAGRLTRFRDGRRVLVSRAEIEAYLERGP